MIVSIVIPCYNVASYIEECILSVLQQSYNNLEVLCIDNGSSDGTLEILKNLSLKHDEIKVFTEDKPGANAARNKGLHLAKGEWIQFLDADDLLEPTKIEHQLKLVNKDINLAFVAGACRRRPLRGPDIVHNDLQQEKYISVFLNKCGNTCSNLWKRDFLLKIYGWNQNLESSQEADLMYRIVLAGGEYIIDEKDLTIIRERQSGQISQSNPVDRWKRYIEVKLSYLIGLQKINPKEYDTLLSEFQDAMVVTLLIYAQYNLDDAEDYFYNITKHGWKSRYSCGLSFLKVMLINFFGFKFYCFLTSKLSK
jgi:glycosyltransferase involved in cell wall biosynthesis